ncbi:hypothetical protein C4B63_57g31 [Trypanosoma cruzi]|uniref:Endonuclease-reverse transcriptase/Reverse transcriptase (RNA-dependent DNA polymerase) n=1 Tax=Trypanosoma cruzi TaxID=5693 RepID=A0A2V2V5Y3_TRYCR|nr:hypothetical protein C4B63_57g31 [Trypanosoma cruzi]
MLLEARTKRLGASPSPRWRYLHGVAAPHPHPLESVVLRTELRTASVLCLGNRKICLSVILCVFTCHTALYCCCCSLHSFGSWWLGNGSVFPPYVLDVAIRESSLGSAPGPGDLLNEFLHRLGPVARGTLRTMIHKSFANGSLPGSWNTVDTIPIPKPGKDPCRPVSYRPTTLLSVLLKLTEGMIHRRLSALLPHHPRQFRICTSAF